MCNARPNCIDNREGSLSPARFNKKQIAYVQDQRYNGKVLGIGSENRLSMRNRYGNIFLRFFTFFLQTIIRFSQLLEFNFNSNVKTMETNVMDLDFNFIMKMAKMMLHIIHI